VRDSFLALVLVIGLTGCGDKVPESSEARKVGGAPKQVVDNATADVAKAIEQGSARSSDGDK
jgi:hypothetical protein